MAPSFKSAVPELHPNPEAAHDFAVALVRRNADNTLSIVFGSHNERLVSQVLAEAGKAAQQAENDAAATQQQTQSRSPETFTPRVREILEAEQVEISDDDLRDVLATTNGSWRDALSAAQDIIIASNRKP